ncbi:hypothetical protein C0J52_00966 [Blattella germanica]|nr:hypothetical protein C0J52_00966 [Blattella germanica]
MSEIKNRERILEAIDQLRRRKARPDAERICNFVFRRFAVDSQDTIADLERLVEEDIVVKVEYKGNISYRNAAKWSRYAVYHKTGGSLNSEGTSTLLSGAVAELIIQEPDYLDFGVPGSELEKYIQEKDSTRFTKRYLEVILQRELNSGNIVKLENGNYSLADHPVPSASSVSSATNSNETVKMLKVDSPSSSQQVSEEEDNSPRGQTDSVARTNESNLFYDLKKESDAGTPGSASTDGFRDGGKRKRSKKVFFDPSDVHVPTRKRGRPVGSTNKNKALNKANIGRPEVEKGFCVICSYRGQDREELVSCKDCSNKAHPSCVDVKEDRLWQCSQCKACAVCLEPCQDPLHSDPQVDESIPDVSSWSVEQVAHYLEQQGYNLQASVFRNNDIDGASLLLMKRSDVLMGLQLKLGPALKVYGQVKKLQLRQSDLASLTLQLFEEHEPGPVEDSIHI